MTSAAEEEQALRRVRSTDDIPSLADPPFGPPRAQNSTLTSYCHLLSVQLSFDPVFLSPIPLSPSPSLSSSPPTPPSLHEETSLRLHSPHSPIPHPSRSPRLPSSQKLSHSPIPFLHHPTVPMPQLPPNNPMPSPIIERTDFVGRVLTFFGCAGPNAKAKEELVRLIWNLTLEFAQVCICHT